MNSKNPSDLKIVYNDYFGSRHGNQHLAFCLKQHESVSLLRQVPRSENAVRNEEEVNAAIQDTQPDVVLFGGSINRIYLKSMSGVVGDRVSIRICGDAYDDVFVDHYLPHARNQRVIYTGVKSWEHMAPNIRFYWQPGWPAVRQPSQSKDCVTDVLFTGGSYSPERLEFVEYLRRTFGARLSLFGNWQKFYPEIREIFWPATSDWNSRSRIVVNHTDRRFRHLQWYLSDRVHTAMLSGRPVATVRTRDLETAYVTSGPGQNLILLDGDTAGEEVASLERACREYSDEDLDRIGQNGRAWASQYATYETLAQRIVTDPGGQ